MTLPADATAETGGRKGRAAGQEGDVWFSVLLIKHHGRRGHTCCLSPRGELLDGIGIRDVTNSWLRQNRISEYGEHGQKWAIFVFSKRKTAFLEHQIRFSE